MLPILEYYTSGFWIWAGITYGMAMIGFAVAWVVSAWRGRG